VSTVSCFLTTFEYICIILVVSKQLLVDKKDWRTKMADQVWVNTQMPVELKEKLETIATLDERSASATIRLLIAAEWKRRNISEIVSQKENNTVDC